MFAQRVPGELPEEEDAGIKRLCHRVGTVVPLLWHARAKPVAQHSDYLHCFSCSYKSDGGMPNEIAFS